ncbi:MAG: hypothetical protein FJ147_17205 [Deltaproteobacteria bacterium]|nr:hypothetical protein [Deltaproteobacteria bacterium]
MNVIAVPVQHTSLIQRREKVVGRQYSVASREQGARGWRLETSSSLQAPSFKSLAPPVFTQPSALGPRALSSPILTPQSPTPSVFRQEGEYWTLVFDNQVCRLRDMRGLHYIAYLLQYPNDDIHVFRLVTGDEIAAEMSTSNTRLSGVEALSMRASDSGELLDAQARAAYKQRMADLQSDLDEAMSFHDQGRIDALREELEFLTHEISQAVGLGGRTRRIGSPTERARSTVTKAVKNALKKICEHHAALGLYLTRTIKTGTFCVYAPDPRASVPWQL